MQAVEVAVVGGGPVGLTTAVALATAGIDTALIAKRDIRPDNRTTALLLGSVHALARLKVWEICRGLAAPLQAIRIIDDTRRLFRAPEITFVANEIGCEAFGYNIENRDLLAALDARAAVLAHLLRVEEAAEAIDPRAGGVEVVCASGHRLWARLAIGADGRRSICRAAANITTDRFAYDQAALTVNAGHRRPHHGISTEFHLETGPFTLVPLPGQRASVVYVIGLGAANRLARLDRAGLAATLERRSHAILGELTVEGPCAIFQLSLERVRCFAAGRIALVGEAAHVLPPIGAQGLNLGLRDAAAIAELVVDVRRAGKDIGAPEVMNRYDASRRADAATRIFAVDVLNRSLMTDFLPAQGLRGLALYLLDRIGPLRRAVMREGIAPSLGTPRLMRGEPL